ncbi:MAG: ATP-grasp domain-containing protein [Xanthobacteraceae bacterium]|nr:ATP-grasp domain-containing protein [Xanthobacteraceae bacterium]
MSNRTAHSPDIPKSASSVLPGVVILGGAHNALALARSFGRKGIPVVLVSDDHPLPSFSRYVHRSLDWPGATAPDAAAWLLAFAAQNGFQSWLLLPCADNEVRLVAENHTLLSASFQVFGTPWQKLQHLCNKQLLVHAAQQAGIAVPKSYDVNSADDAASVEVTFPVVLKPAMRMVRNAFTSAKAWRAETRNELVELYRTAAALQGQDGIVVQEYIPGGGEAQFSYAGLWSRNAPVAELSARRTRQYPVEFGYTSTFVEIVDNDEVMRVARKLLSSIGFEGLVEVEFKYDARFGTYKILDVNPRSWSWLSLCEAGGFDFAHSTEAILKGETRPVQHAASGHAWIHASRDLAAAIQLMMMDRLNLGDWFKGYRQKLTWAVFAWDDPVPAFLELPTTLARVALRMFARNAQAIRPQPKPLSRNIKTKLL